MHTPNMQKPAAGKAHGLCEDDQLATAINFKAIPQTETTQGREAVHHRGDLIGFVVTVPSGFEAVTAGGPHLGRFNQPGAAARALATHVFTPRADCADCNV